MTTEHHYIYSEEEKLVQLIGKRDYQEILASVKGDKFRQYRKLWDEAGKFERETVVPLHLDFEFITACNYRCKMCHFGMPKENRLPNFDKVSGKFPFELFKKVIDEGVEKGLYALDLSYNNEPLLRDDIMSFINYADEKGVLDVMFSTNGSLLTPELTEKILDSGLARFLISLDAHTKKTYEQIRIGGNFETVVGNLEYFLRRKKERKQVLPIIRVSFVKSAINESELKEFIDHWEPIVDYLSIQEIITYDVNKDMRAKNRSINKNFRCHMPWHRLTLRANGDVLPCCNIWGQELVMGNIADSSLEDIWMSSEFHDLRILHKNGEYYKNAVCKKCFDNGMIN